jgi:hypothetical protein
MGAKVLCAVVSLVAGMASLILVPGRADAG